MSLKAWRNLIVCAVNEALRRGIFSLKPNQNYWSSVDSVTGDNEQFPFDFLLPGNLSARIAVSDARFDELAIHVAVNPKGDNVRNFDNGFSAGDALATTWLERQNGAWVQSRDDNFHCRPHLIPLIAGINVQPFGYGDRGRLIM